MTATMAFPDGVSQFNASDGTVYVPDTDGNATVTDFKTFKEMLNAGFMPEGIILQGMIGDAAVGKGQVSYETHDLVFGATDTSKTATVEAGSIIIGWVFSSVTGTPALGSLAVKLVVSSTTLTGTLAAAPGTSNGFTVTVVLLKV